MTTATHSYKLILKCTLGGTIPTAVVQCFSGSSSDIAGVFRVTSEGRTRQYGYSDMWQDLSGQTASIDLNEPFSVTIMAGGTDDTVLDARVSDCGKTIAQDQSSKYTPVNFDSDDLESEGCARSSRPSDAGRGAVSSRWQGTASPQSLSQAERDAAADALEQFADEAVGKADASHERVDEADAPRLRTRGPSATEPQAHLGATVASSTLISDRNADVAAADRRLNQMWSQTRARLTPEQRAGLLQSQRTWIKQRDAACNPSGVRRPTLDQLNATCAAGMTRSRADWLKRFEG